MRLKPLSLREANSYVGQYHRHSNPTRGHKFSIGVVDGDNLVGVAIIGRPVARMLDDGYTAEVLRVCTTGARNACSMLYGAARRACFGMGYDVVVTYIREDEDGASLRASGYVPVAEVKAQEWGRPSRARTTQYEVMPRQRWEVRRERAA